MAVGEIGARLNLIGALVSYQTGNVVAGDELRQHDEAESVQSRAQGGGAVGRDEAGRDVVLDDLALALESHRPHLARRGQHVADLLVADEVVGAVGQAVTVDVVRRRA